MNRRQFIALLLLAFQGLFLNVVVPGHIRGAITLNGERQATSLADLGCPLCAPDHAHDHKGPTPANRADCEICYLAIGLTLPPPVDFDWVKMGVIALAPAPAPATIAAPPFILSPQSRGPPCA